MKKFFFFLPSLLFSQILFEAESDKYDLWIDDRVQVNFVLTVNNEKFSNLHESITLPNFEGFEVLHSGMSKSTNIINGKVSFNLVYQIVLRAIKSGNLKINPAIIKIQGKTYKTQVLNFKIQGELLEKRTKNSITETPFNRETFVLFEIEKKDPYINENVLASINLYTKNYTVLNRITSFQLPVLKGITIIPLGETKHIEQVEKFGDVYIKATLQKLLLYPIRSGSITVPKYTISIMESDEFFNEREVTIQSPLQHIHVKEFPKNSPKNFAGAVGNFNINLILDKPFLRIDSTAQIEVEVTGSGNFKLIKTPNILIPQEFETYNDNHRDGFEITENGLKGKIVSSKVLVPEFSGKYEIKTEPFTFFNPKTQSYHTIPSKSIHVQVNENPKTIIKSRKKKSEILFNKEQKNYLKVFNPININKISDIFDSKKKEKSNVLIWSICLILILISSIYWVVRRFIVKNLQINHKSDSFLEYNQDKRIISNKEIISKIEESNCLSKTMLNFNEIDSLVISNNKKAYYHKLEKLLYKIAKDDNRMLRTINEMENQMFQKFGEIDSTHWKKLVLKCQIEKFAPISDEYNLSEIHQSIKSVIKQWI